VFQSVRFAIVRFAAVFKDQANVFDDRGLIVFGDKDVVSRPLFDKIVREFALCEQCVGGDRLPVNVEPINDRDEHPDFIGLFERIASFYRQSTDFFWV